MKLDNFCGAEYFYQQKKKPVFAYLGEIQGSLGL